MFGPSADGVSTNGTPASRAHLGMFPQFACRNDFRAKMDACFSVMAISSLRPTFVVCRRSLLLTLYQPTACSNGVTPFEKCSLDFGISNDNVSPRTFLVMLIAATDRIESRRYYHYRTVWGKFLVPLPILHYAPHVRAQQNR